MAFQIQSFFVEEFSILDSHVKERSDSPTNTSRVFLVEETWKQPFPRCFNVEHMW